MSITIDYFFNDDRSLPELAEEINDWLGCQLSPYQNDPNDFFCRLFGMEFALSEHRLENDGELDFQNYRYELGIRTPLPDADFRPFQLPVMALVAYALYSRLRITGILVFDVQLLLARYKERLNPGTNTVHLFDEVSNEFVSYPKHISDLVRRMPENSFSAAWEEPTIKLLQAEGNDVEIPGR
ncbi:MAG TPA: hypothetical protein VNO70_00765 [Blastocatellia bacterium]|nr:hypothetical protein [Blastocatellia bacterium]